MALLLVAAVPCDRVRPLPKRAECERKAGHTLKAIELVELHLTRRRGDLKAKALREALEAELVHAQLFSEPEGALVAVDGADPAGSTPLTVRLDAGRHVFRFTLDGHLPLEREQQLVAGTRPQVTGVLEPVAKPAQVERADAGELPATGAAAEAASGEQASSGAEPAPAEAVAAPPATASRERAHSNAPLVIGAAGLFVAIGGGVLVLTSALAPPSDGSAWIRQYTGYALAGVGVAAGVAAIIWLLLERRPGAER